MELRHGPAEVLEEAGALRAIHLFNRSLSILTFKEFLNQPWATAERARPLGEVEQPGRRDPVA
ncbi:MAG TPA: hypothetical protein VFW70_09425 [Methylomirabilota bacterium]|nr:hypothetical protein [Methylomirabilota bacterium]